MDYKKIEILEKDLLIPTKIRIIMEDGTEEIIKASEENKSLLDKNECWKKLQEFWLKEQDEYESTASFVYENPKIEEKITSFIEEKDIEPVEECKESVSSEKVTKKEKKSNKGRIVITSLAVAAIVSALGYGYTLVKNNNLVPSKSEKPGKSIVSTVDHNSPVNNPFTTRVDGIVKNESGLSDSLSNIAEGKQISYDEYINALSNQAAISFSNMYEISEFVNGKGLNGNVVRPEFYNIFDIGTLEYGAVMRFNILHNNIIYYAYDERNLGMTEVSIDEFNKNFIDFVLNGNGCFYTTDQGMQDVYYFEELSPMAKNTIIQMGMAVLTIEHDFNLNIAGVQYNRMRTIEEVSSLSNIVMQELKGTQTFK